MAAFAGEVHKALAGSGKGKPSTAEDIRYTVKADLLYAFVLAKPAGDVRFVSLGKSAKLLDRSIAKVEQLGVGGVKWTQADDSLTVTPDISKVAKDQTIVFRISPM